MTYLLSKDRERIPDPKLFDMTLEYLDKVIMDESLPPSLITL